MTLAGLHYSRHESAYETLSQSGNMRSGVWERAIRQGWGGRPVLQEQAQGILVAALGMLAAHLGYGEAGRAS